MPARLCPCSSLPQPSGVRNVQERLPRRGSRLPAAEVQLYLPPTHHQIVVVPINDLEPKRSVVTGGAVEVCAVQDGDRHGGRSRAPRNAVPQPPGSESRIEPHHWNIA